MTKLLKNYWIILPSNRHTSSNQNSRWVHSLRRVVAYHFDKSQNHQYWNDHNLLSELKLQIVTWFGPKYDLDNAKKNWNLHRGSHLILSKQWYFGTFRDSFIYIDVGDDIGDGAVLNNRQLSPIWSRLDRYNTCSVDAATHKKAEIRWNCQFLKVWHSTPRGIVSI